MLRVRLPPQYAGPHRHAGMTSTFAWVTTSGPYQITTNLPHTHYIPAIKLFRIKINIVKREMSGQFSVESCQTRVIQLHRVFAIPL